MDNLSQIFQNINLLKTYVPIILIYVILQLCSRKNWDTIYIKINVIEICFKVLALNNIKYYCVTIVLKNMENIVRKWCFKWKQSPFFASFENQVTKVNFICYSIVIGIFVKILRYFWGFTNKHMKFNKNKKSL